jgi:hypothetical protein
MLKILYKKYLKLVKLKTLKNLYNITSVKYFDRRPPQRRQRRASDGPATGQRRASDASDGGDIAFDALGTLPSL